MFADSELNPVPIAASKTGLPAAPHKQQHIPGQNCEITVKDQNGKTAEVEVFCTPDGKVYLNLLYGLNNNHA